MRGRLIVRAILALCFVALGLFFSGVRTPFSTRAPQDSKTIPTRAEVESSALQIEHPPSVQAGTPVRVRVHGADNASTVTLIVVGSASGLTSHGQKEGQATVFRLSPDVTRMAGNVRLIARAANKFGTSTITIRPGPLQNIVDPIVGPRTIVADGRDTTMSVAFPMDVLGNVAEDGTPVEMLLEHADATLSEATTTVRGLIAWHEFTARTTAGNATANATAADQSGRPFTIRETPAPPAALALLAPERPPVADGFSLLRVRTSMLRDVNGNTLDDGTSVVFSWDGPEGRARATSKTLAGVAELVVEAPAVAGTVRITAWCLGTSSAPLEVSFLPAVDEIPARVDRDGSRFTIRVGPVFGKHRAYLRDGTWARIVMNGSDGGRVERRVQLVAASAITNEVTTELHGVVDIDVTVLGHTQALSLQPHQRFADTGGTGVADQIVAASRVDRVK